MSVIKHIKPKLSKTIQNQKPNQKTISELNYSCLNTGLRKRQIFWFLFPCKNFFLLTGNYNMFWCICIWCINS